MSRVWRAAGVGLFCVLLFLAVCPAVLAQTPVPAATNPGNKDAGGFTTGWTLGTKFEGSYSSDGGVYDVGTALGYNFSRHFGMDVGAPLYFVTTPTSIKKSNAGAVSGVGVGSSFSDLRWNYPHESLNYSSAIHVTVPTGDTKKGFSVGHITWNQTNHFDHAFGDWTPFLDAGVGNTCHGHEIFHAPIHDLRFERGVHGRPRIRQGTF